MTTKNPQNASIYQKMQLHKYKIEISKIIGAVQKGVYCDKK